MLARVLWVLGVWAFTVVACLLFVSGASLGPTLWTIDGARGVHLGDLVAVVAFPAGALWISRSILARD